MEKATTINLKGKEYAEVAERVALFRNDIKYAGFGIVTEWKTLTDDVAVCQASITDASGRVVSQGTAREIHETPEQLFNADGSPRKDSYGRNMYKMSVNSTDYVENCETSAVGRALSNFGFLSNGKICSPLDVEQAKTRQKEIADFNNEVSKLKEQLPNTTPEEGASIRRSIVQKAMAKGLKFDHDAGLFVSK